MILGIDPGKSGGYVFLDDSGNIFDSLIAPVTKDKKIDIEGIDCWLKFHKSICAVTCVIEEVHSVFSSSAKSNFAFGYSVGIIPALLIANGLTDIVYVSPKNWQALSVKGTDKIEKTVKGKVKKDTKAMAAVAFRNIFPDNVVSFMRTALGNKSKNLHDGIVDAALIAHWYKESK